MDRLERMAAHFYRKNKGFKIEFEDLLQEARIIYFQTKDYKEVEKGLRRYIYKWRKNPLSTATSFDNRG